MTLLKHLVAIFVFAATCAGAVENIVPQRGHAAAPISWTDESGRVRNVSEFAGYPVVLLPMYTRCPSACLRTVAQLKKALVDSAADPTQFRVLLFSIDPTDTPATLAAYRQREAVPLGWFLGAADQSSIDALLESVGFQSAKAGTEFMHPQSAPLSRLETASREVDLRHRLHRTRCRFGSKDRKRSKRLDRSALRFSLRNPGFHGRTSMRGIGSATVAAESAHAAPGVGLVFLAIAALFAVHRSDAGAGVRNL